MPGKRRGCGLPKQPSGANAASLLPDKLFENQVEGPGYTSPQRAQRAIVDHYMIGQRPFLVKWHLRFFPPIQLLGRPASSSLQTLQTYRSWRIDEENAVALGGEPRFDQKRSVNDKCAGAGRCTREHGSAALMDERVHDRLKPCSFHLCPFPREDASGNLRSVHRSITLSNATAPPLHDCIMDLSIGERGTGMRIGVGDHTAQRCQFLRDGRLAGADGANKSDHGNTA